jgi:inosine/xanthosine triphosphatase
MKKIVVASLNPVKVEAVLNGFKRLFPGEDFRMVPVSVDSGGGRPAAF